MLSAYRTLAETGRVLGVSARRVRDFIENGPLNAVETTDGLMVHNDDLIAFRRPLYGIASSSNKSPPSGRDMLRGFNQSQTGVVLPTTQNNSLIIGPCGGSCSERQRVAAGRNTMSSAGFRALRDLDLVDAASDRFDRLTTPEPNTGCVLWVGAMDCKGYGYFRLTSNQVVFSHRYAFVRASRWIEERDEVDHLCHNRWCVLDAHLEAVSKQENIRRRDIHRTALGLPDNLAIARAARRHLRLVRP